VEALEHNRDIIITPGAEAAASPQWQPAGSPQREGTPQEGSHQLPEKKRRTDGPRSSAMVMPIDLEAIRAAWRQPEPDAGGSGGGSAAGGRFRAASLTVSRCVAGGRRSLCAFACPPAQQTMGGC
jgi:hypothetical protein